MAIDWSSIGTGAVSGLAAGSALGPWGAAAGALVGGIGGFFKSDYEKQTQVDAENRQEQNQIEAEQRANAEYDRRMADERAYNDPAAQAERMRQAGINPMANLGQGVTSSSTNMTAPTQSNAPTGVGQRSTGPLGVSEGLQLMTMAEQAKRAKLENEMLSEQIKTERIEQILKMSDVELKQQLFDYNSKANPYLLEGLLKRNQQYSQDLKNSQQEYENLVKTGEATDQQIEESKQRVEESKQRVIESQANVLVLKAREQNLISDTTYKGLLGETEKWHAKKMEEEYHIATVDFDTKDSVYRALHDSGAYKAMIDAERKKAEAFANMADSQLQQFRDVWNLDDSSFFGQMARFMLYLCTNMFSFGGSINQSFTHR